MTTKARLKRIIRESMEQYRPQKTRNYNQVSDGMKSMANAAKRKFAKDYPEVKVKIDGRQGWIIVNDVKAVNVSSASGSPMSIEDMVDQMKQAYLGHPMAEAKLRRIIKEEARKLLNEQYGQDVDPGNHLISFANAWAGLGDAVQEQVTSVLVSWNEGGHEPDWSMTVYEQNPAAIAMAQQKLGPFLGDLGKDGGALADALEEAQKIYREGDAEVERDATAAGDRPRGNRPR